MFHLFRFPQLITVFADHSLGDTHPPVALNCFLELAEEVFCYFPTIKEIKLV